MNPKFAKGSSCVGSLLKIALSLYLKDPSHCWTKGPKDKQGDVFSMSFFCNCFYLDLILDLKVMKASPSESLVANPARYYIITRRSIYRYFSTFPAFDYTHI